MIGYAARRLLLSSARLALKNSPIPGRYLAAELIGHALMPSHGLVQTSQGSYKLLYDLRDQMQRQIFFGLYDRCETNLLQQILQPGQICLDIGANVGYYTFLAAQLVGPSGQVHAFEPIPANARLIAQAISRNGARQVTLQQVAVGDSSEYLTLFIGDGRPDNSGWASAIPSTRRPVATQVPQLRIDDYLRAAGIAHVDVVKLDIEGGEPAALAGMAELLARPDAPILLIEVNPYYLERQGRDSTALTGVLARHGYNIWQTSDPSGRPIAPEQRLDRLVNLIAAKAPLGRGRR